MPPGRVRDPTADSPVPLKERGDPADEIGMSWIPIAVALVLAGSLLAGLAVAATLGAIAGSLSRLEHEIWSTMPVSASTDRR
jgi:hypothetical protein